MSMRKLKYKGEMHQAITGNINSIKNPLVLREICCITDIYQRAYDEKMFETVTETEWNKIFIVNTIINEKNEKRLGKIKALIEGSLGKRKDG